MIFTYRPEGADVREWSFRVGKLLSPESEAIEKVTGLYIPQFKDALENGSHAAARRYVAGFVSDRGHGRDAGGGVRAGYGRDAVQ